MKIGIVSLDDSRMINAGGKHIHQQLLEKGLINSNHQVECFFPRKRLKFIIFRVLFAVLNKLGIKKKSSIYAWTLNHHKNDLVSQIKKTGSHFDGFFTQDPVSAVAAFEAVQDSSKIVLTLHGYLSLESVNYGGFEGLEKDRVIESALVYEKKALECAKKIITVDTRISKYLKSELSYSKDCFILKNAINPELFNTTAEEVLNELKKELNLPNDHKVVLVPRRLVKKNGVEIAVRSVTHLISKFEGKITFLIMGDGPLFKELTSLKETLKIPDLNIKFLGSVNYSKAPLYYDLCDIVLVPSIISDGVEEATSLSMLEGMAAKKIVIVSNIGGMKEVIVDSENGFLIEQNNVDNLVDQISKAFSLKEDELLRLTEKAYDDVCERHHYLNHTKEYLSQLEN